MLLLTSYIKLRDLLKYVYAGLWEYLLIVWYFAKSKSVASIDNVRWTLTRLMYDEGSPCPTSKDKQGFVERGTDSFRRDVRYLQHLFLSDAHKSWWTKQSLNL